MRDRCAAVLDGRWLFYQEKTYRCRHCGRIALGQDYLSSYDGETLRFRCRDCGGRWTEEEMTLNVEEVGNA